MGRIYDRPVGVEEDEEEGGEDGEEHDVLASIQAPVHISSHTSHQYMIHTLSALDFAF